MPGINAALGMSQMKKLPELLSKKRKLFKKYFKAFEKSKYVSLIKEPKNCKSNYWLQALVIKKGYVNFKIKILEKTNSSGITTRPIWQPMHLSKQFSKCPKMNLKITEKLYKNVICLPSRSFLVD